MACHLRKQNGTNVWLLYVTYPCRKCTLIWGTIFIFHGDYLYLTSLGFWTRIIFCDLQNTLHHCECYENIRWLPTHCWHGPNGLLIKKKKYRKKLTWTQTHEYNVKIEHFLRVVSPRVHFMYSRFFPQCTILEKWWCGQTDGQIVGLCICTVLGFLIHL
jgi:hypothetical protein